MVLIRARSIDNLRKTSLLSVDDGVKNNTTSFTMQEAVEQPAEAVNVVIADQLGPSQSGSDPAVGETGINIYSWFNKGWIGHWELRIGKLSFGGHSSKSLNCFICLNAQLPITNDQLQKQHFLILAVHQSRFCIKIFGFLSGLEIITLARPCERNGPRD